MADTNTLVRNLYDELSQSGFLGLGGCDDDKVIDYLREGESQMSQLKQAYASQHPSGCSAFFGRNFLVTSCTISCVQ